MQFTINHMPVDILFQTVTICPNKEEEDNVYLFRCDRCGTGLNQIQGSVSRMYPGEPTGDIPVITKCYKCKKRHLFKSTDIHSAYTNVGLHHEYEPSKYSFFHCVICRTQLFRYNGFVVEKLPEFSKLSIPFRVMCPLPSCTQKYLVNDMI